jgi:hypothetical protein
VAIVVSFLVHGPSWGVLLLDNGPIHVSKASRAALEAHAHWLTIEWLPKYAFEQAIIRAVTIFNHEARFHPLASQRISASPFGPPAAR